MEVTAVSSPSILIVEDESIIAEDISESLRRAGYGNTAIVNSGARAIELMKTLRPDIILMDIKLKGPLDGIETARLIRDQGPAPVVYHTANADQRTMDRAKSTEPIQ